MLATEEASGHFPYLAEIGEGQHLLGLGDLEGTSLLQGLTACKRNKQTNSYLEYFEFSYLSTNHSHNHLPWTITDRFG